MTGRIYSERLGAISDAQFAEATRRLGLGDFLSAEPVAAGLFGQNVFIATTTGQFVLRGAPHWVPVKRGDGTMQWERDDRVQFAKEAFFIRETHAHTAAPVPWREVLGRPLFFVVYAAVLALNFPEAKGAESQALMYAALVLLAITLAVNVLGTAIVNRASRRLQGIR